MEMSPKVQCTSNKNHMRSQKIPGPRVLKMQLTIYAYMISELAFLSAYNLCNTNRKARD